MRAVVIHSPRDLRVEDIASQPLGANDVRIRIAVGGICGSDIHYYNHGGPGSIRIREPMVLGHEVSGTIVETGSPVTGLAPGQRVAVNPSRACGQCRRCREGLAMHCENMLFMGSAMRFPHVQGGFREELVLPAVQAIPIPDSLSAGEAAMAEPLAVCLHALERAGSIAGKRVLITGCGPIGLLIVAVCRNAGALDIVATDISGFPTRLALKMGADFAFDLLAEPSALDTHVDEHGPFDFVFEAAGAVQSVQKALGVLRPRGIMVQVGMAGEIPVPITPIVTREIEVRGTFRFDKEFALAVKLLARKRIDVRPLITAAMPFEQANAAFLLANDRSQSAKVQLQFAGEG